MGGDRFKLKLLTDNIVEVVLDDNLYLDVSVTDRIDELLEEMVPKRKIYQLVIASGPYIVNPEMRNSMSQGDTGIKQLAIAWISPDEKSNQEQEAIVSKLPLPVQIRFFSDREKGLVWLKSLASQAG